MSPIIKQTAEFARHLHTGQKRQSGDDYFDHCLAVMKTLESLPVPNSFLQIALLHDILEETTFSYEQLRFVYGYFVADCVNFLSKDFYPTKEERIKKYIAKLQQGFFFSSAVYMVKLADVLHNTNTLKYFPISKQIQQLTETKEYYLPFFCKNIILINPVFQLPAYEIISFLEKKCHTLKTISLKC